MMDPKLRFGLVGAGGIAQAYAQAFRRTEIARVVAVADVREDAARALAEGLGAQAYDSYAAMARRARLDAVIVCTPPVTHAEVCQYFLEHQVHVLCEKPFTIDGRSARRLADTAARAGLKLTMGSKFRYVQDVIRAKSIVASGILGEIILFENAFTARVDMARRWNADPAVSGGGVLIDNGTHSVDIARYLLGPIAEVFAVDATRRLDLPVEDSARLMLRSAGGTVGAITLSWVLESFSNTYLELLGSEGSLRVGYSRSRFRQSSSPQWIEFGAGYNKIIAHSRQLENFAGALRGTAELIVTPADALASVSAIEAAYASIASGSWSPVSPDCS